MSNSKVNCQREFEWIQENFQRYKRELELINRQNPYECELYSVIATVIRCCMWDESISLRDVSQIHKCERLHTKNFRSEWGSPDFIILDKTYHTDLEVRKKDIYLHDTYKYGIFGAVEIKYMYYDFVKKKNGEMFQFNFKEEIEEHIRYFKKVIYTNGLVWQLYLFDDSKSERDTRDIERNEMIKEFILGTMKDKKNRLISWEPNAEEIWKDLVDYIHRIDWKTYGKI